MNGIHLEELCAKHRRRRQRRQHKYLFGGSCAYCGATPYHSDAITLDHVVPKSKGGSNSFDNLLPCCTYCNGDKGSEDLWDWWQRQDFYSESRAMAVSAFLAGWWIA